MVAGAVVAAAVGTIVYHVAKDRPTPIIPDMANPGAPASDRPGGAAPDISRMSARERFDRLYDRIMLAVERGDSATVTGFAPMALGAYAQLDTIDTDARYHVAMIELMTGSWSAAEALADTIQQETPGHLFIYVIRGEAATRQGQTSALTRNYGEFLDRYDAEMRADRVEYREHRPVLDDFRRRATAAIRGEGGLR